MAPSLAQKDKKEYAREVQRIKAKPTVVNRVYLGSADRILEVFLGKSREAPPRGFASKELGSGDYQSLAKS